MKIIQIYDSRLAASNPSETRHWQGQHRLMSAALSCLQLFKLYKQVHLVTDTAGKEILIDTLQLPYTSHDLDVDEFYSAFPGVSAILLKPYIFQKQQEAFLFVSDDIFLWRKLNPTVTETPTLALFKKYENQVDYQTIIKLRKLNVEWMSVDALKIQPQYSFDTKVCGGHDTLFFKSFFSEVKQIVTESGNTGELLFGDSLIDWVFCQMVMRKGIRVRCLMDDYFDELHTRAFVVFEQLRTESGLSYLPDALKGESLAILYLKLQLRHLYPQIYIAIEKLFTPTPGFTSIAANTRDKTFQEVLFHDDIVHLGGSVQQKFQRTLFAIEKLLPHDGRIVTLLKTHAAEKLMSLIEALLDDSIPEVTKALLSDVYQFEKSKYRFELQNLNRNSLYTKECERFTTYLTLCELTDDELLSCHLAAAPDVLIIENAWKWGVHLEIEELYRLRVIYNAGVDKDQFFTLLWPESVSCSVKEYDLEQFDVLLLDAFEEPRSIAEAVSLLQTYFEEDVEANREILIAFTLKRVRELFYMGALMVAHPTTSADIEFQFSESKNT